MAQRTVLLVNKFYHDVGPAGGVGRYVVQEQEDLLAAGWNVVPFAMAEDETLPTPWREHFVTARDYSQPRFGAGGARDALSLLWNREAARKLDRLLTAARPDVAHLHNIYHHLTPSILPVLRRHGVPVVMTLHDLRLLCPAIHMLRRGEICERCHGRQWHQAVLGRCVKDSLAASLLAAVETAHQRSRRLYEDQVSLFLCPSRFYVQKHREWGFPEWKLQHLPNFVDLDTWNPARLPSIPNRDAYIYFGRISREKGLRYLLEAHGRWEAGYETGRIPHSPLKLLIAGTGPCEGNVRAGAARLGLKNVEILGGLAPDRLRHALARSRFSVMPSIWYENGPMAGLESLAMGIPLVGSDIGGIPEIIRNGTTGFVVKPADADDLLRGLLRACELDDASAAARDWAEKHADRRTHMAALTGILDRFARGYRTV